MKYLFVIVKWLIRLAIVAVLLWVFVLNYDFIFKKQVIGYVVAAEKINGPLAVIDGNSKIPFNPQLFSFSIGIKDRFSGEIFMASSEDRQWAAVNLGNCVIAAYFPYPPWRLDKGSTSHNARLLRNFTNCEQLPKLGWFDSFKFFFLLN